jgi:hypothetical protein
LRNHQETQTPEEEEELISISILAIDAQDRHSALRRRRIAKNLNNDPNNHLLKVPILLMPKENRMVIESFLKISEGSCNDLLIYQPK